VTRSLPYRSLIGKVCQPSHSLLRISSSLRHPSHATVTLSSAELEQLVAELDGLKQRLGEYDRLFHQLGLKESHDSFNLSLPL
jgi:hypothetical protein